MFSDSVSESKYRVIVPLVWNDWTLSFHNYYLTHLFQLGIRWYHVMIWKLVLVAFSCINAENKTSKNNAKKLHRS